MSSTALRKTLRVALWSLAWLVLAVVFVRAFIGDVYYVDSPSMEPTLHGADQGGDWVFVRYEKRPKLARFDLAILRRTAGSEYLVKRVAALPGESVQVSGGDLFVNGARPGEAARPPLVEIFASERDEFAGYFDCLPVGHWTKTGDAWRVEGRGQRELFAQWHTRLTDDYRKPDGTRNAGTRQIGDAALEVEARVEGTWKSLSLRLTEEGDVFAVELTQSAATTAHARLLRAPSIRALAQDKPSDVLAEGDVPFGADAWHRLRFSNIDNELRFDLDDRRCALRAPYSSNVPLTGMPDVAMLHVMPRLEFGGDDLVAKFRRVRVERDFNYTGLGRHGTERSQILGPDEVFVLGDNSGESVDSREWGPVKLDDVIGEPLWVVWPPSRMRRLRPTERASQ
jgi:signal peptidase I